NLIRSAGDRKRDRVARSDVGQVALIEGCYERQSIAGRIDEVATALDEADEDRPTCRLVGAPAPLLAEGHRPETELRDSEPTRAQQRVCQLSGLIRHRQTLKSGCHTASRSRRAGVRYALE